eukprot:CAMPEP_0201903982 /NCGR_PEP_ID=MMETSP0902-20130614/55760_1 /ASSEMBLY_ACC=CAM_ASM_000551 /TAXON_ID=420261 /ORGANISM="Thalassiosira antarctica, Strain CCMP982" /LENGTH=228 /DNA_ID=CAMNT_0048438051 /DNA_START=739 /DNA_END=1423 /DNA_ORIENTATION=-
MTTKNSPSPISANNDDKRTALLGYGKNGGPYVKCRQAPSIRPTNKVYYKTSSSLLSFILAADSTIHQKSKRHQLTNSYTAAATTYNTSHPKECPSILLLPTAASPRTGIGTPRHGKIKGRTLPYHISSISEPPTYCPSVTATTNSDAINASTYIMMPMSYNTIIFDPRQSQPHCVLHMHTSAYIMLMTLQYHHPESSSTSQPPPPPAAYFIDAPTSQQQEQPPHHGKC